MTDDDLMTMVGNSFTSVHVTTSVEKITRRRTAGARRRILVLTGALTAAAGTALAVTWLLPSP